MPAVPVCGLHLLLLHHLGLVVLVLGVLLHLLLPQGVPVAVGGHRPRPERAGRPRRRHGAHCVHLKLDSFF